MSSLRAPRRLLPETLAILAGCGLVVTLAVPMLFPGNPRWVEADVTSLLLTVTAGPLLWWRYRDCLRAPAETSRTRSAAPSTRRVRVAAVLGLAFVGLLGLGSEVVRERLVRTSQLRGELIDRAGALRWTGQNLSKHAALYVLQPSHNRRKAYDVALAQYESAATGLNSFAAGRSARLLANAEARRRWEETRLRVQQSIAAGRAITEVFDQGGAGAAPIERLLKTTSAAVACVNALNKQLASGVADGTELLNLFGRGMTVLLLAALALVWLLVLGPALRSASLAERDLRHERAQLQAIIECTADGIVAVDAGGAILLANPSLERMLGYAAGELVGRPITTIIPERLRGAHHEGFQRLVAGGDARVLGRSMELPALRSPQAGGDEITVELTLGMTRRGGQVSFAAAVRDISQRRAIQARQRRLVLAMESVEDAILLTDTDGKIVQVNPAFVRLYGYTEAEALGNTPRLLKSGRHPPEFYQQFWSAITSGRTFQHRMINLRKDGSAVHVDASVSPVLAEDGRIEGYVGIHRDIAAQIEREQALQEAQRRIEDVNADLFALNETHAALFACRTVEDVARILTDVLVRSFDAHFARVWLRRPADLCSECALAAHCASKQECLHLVASSGCYTHLDGAHRRVPLGAFKIGLIAAGTGKTISHNVVEDQRVHDRRWAEQHGLRSFVGLPLVRDDRVIGVMALFSQKELPDYVLESTEILAKLGAAAIANVELINSERTATTAAQLAACTDKLTGLPNRALLLDRVQCAVERAQRDPRYHFAVMFLDLDRFKIINDSLGHDFGDSLLRAIAVRLRNSLRPTDSICRIVEGPTVARLGGDEFVVLLDGIAEPRSAGGVAQRLLQVLHAPYQLGRHEVSTTVSIGIACDRAQRESAEEILRNADVAMYQAKARGKGRFVMFDASMQAALEHQHRLENDLRTAIGSQQFRLDFQPIVRLADGRLAGAEALARWDHPTHGLIQPNEFIPVAEETRLISPLNQWVLGEACRQFMIWQQTAPCRAPEYIAVNLSRVQLVEHNLADRILAAVRQAGMRPDQLVLEVTETGMIQNRQAARTVLAELKSAGFRLSMDDFGTGYSSLACLHEFPFDVLKIDQAFIGNLPRGREFIALTQSIITAAACLGMTCVAEGVENEEQADALRGINCAAAQGYYFGYPVSAERLISGDWGAVQNPAAVKSLAATT